MPGTCGAGGRRRPAGLDELRSETLNSARPARHEDRPSSSPSSDDGAGAHRNARHGLFREHFEPAGRCGQIQIEHADHRFFIGSGDVVGHAGPRPSQLMWQRVAGHQNVRHPEPAVPTERHARRGARNGRGDDTARHQRSRLPPRGRVRHRPLDGVLAHGDHLAGHQLLTLSRTRRVRAVPEAGDPEQSVLGQRRWVGQLGLQAWRREPGGFLPR